MSGVSLSVSVVDPRAIHPLDMSVILSKLALLIAAAVFCLASDAVSAFLADSSSHKHTTSTISHRRRYPVSRTKLEEKQFCTRDDFLKQSALLLPWAFFVNPMKSLAATNTVDVKDVTILRGRASLPPEMALAGVSTTSAALYITCRPNRPDNVPAAILNGSRGKSPPVLAARIPLEERSSSNIQNMFPVEFEFRIPRDLTPEGAWDGATPLALDGSTTSIPTTIDELWWKGDELVVSARLDTDGIAATRSPEDLVGRTINKLGPEITVEIQLTGRGSFGKFATGKR